jgi:transposase
VADKHPDDVLTREELLALVRELRAEIERLKRSQHRQAAPFSKEKPVTDPKKPGRKMGQGPFIRREAPAETPDIVVEVQAPANCPYCGGPLELDGFEHPTTTDLPKQPKPQVTEYRVAVCHCRKCGKKVRGTAPGLAPDQYGATAHRVGPTLMAAAQALHYSVGVPVRKVAIVLKELDRSEYHAIGGDAKCDAARQGCGGGGVSAAAGRNPGVCVRPYRRHRMAGEWAFLMGFESDQAAVYQIRPQHRNQEVRELVLAITPE